ncbi:MAG TPA: hypothetical protein VIV61_08160 [Candidatus Ozemobacteraceae bacterium]
MSFLFTIGFLLLFSSSFLAYHAWDGPGYQGSAAALEAPVTPPSLDAAAAPVAPPSAAKPVVQAQPAGTLEVPAEPAAEVKQKETAGKPQEAPIPPAVSEKPRDVPVAKQAKTSPAKTNASVAQKASGKAEVKQAGEKTSRPAQVVPVSQSPKKAETKTWTSRKRRVQKVVEEDITRVPPEWDWFSKPLRVEMKAGKVEILGESTGADATPAMTPVEAASEAVEKGENTISSLEKPQSEPNPPVRSETEIVPPVAPQGAQVAPAPAPASDACDRLATVLARLQARRERRAQEAGEKALALPSQGGEVKHVPASLIRLMNALKAMHSDVGDAPVAAERIPEAQTELHQDASASADSGNSPKDESHDSLRLRME